MSFKSWLITAVWKKWNYAIWVTYQIMAFWPGQTKHCWNVFIHNGATESNIWPLWPHTHTQVGDQPCYPSISLWISYYSCCWYTLQSLNCPSLQVKRLLRHRWTNQKTEQHTSTHIHMSRHTHTNARTHLTLLNSCPVSNNSRPFLSSSIMYPMSWQCTSKRQVNAAPTPAKLHQNLQYYAVSVHKNSAVIL